jgi:hypothetical protein
MVIALNAMLSVKGIELNWKQSARHLGLPWFGLTILESRREQKRG